MNVQDFWKNNFFLSHFHCWTTTQGSGLVPHVKKYTLTMTLSYPERVHYLFDDKFIEGKTYQLFISLFMKENE